MPEQFPLLQKLGDQEHALLRLDYFVELQDVPVPHCLQNADLVLDAHDVFGAHALLVYQFHCDLLACLQVHCEMDFAESALTDVFSYFLKAVPSR